MDGGCYTILMLQKTSIKHGFTLVELSIVLVILGLLVGGVLAGQSLIKAAELRAVTTEYTNYVTAINTFKGKYFALPGDMPNAVRYWGAQAGTTDDGINSTCAGLSAAATGLPTCNGDGNGRVGGTLASNPWMRSPHEVFRFWQHLTNAGLTEGGLTGVSSAGAYGARVGTNVPRSKFNAGAGWGVASYETSVTAAPYATIVFPANYGSYLFLGGNASNTSLQHEEPILKAEDMYTIDMKMDDGKPHTGIVLGYRNSTRPECVTTADNAYALGSTVIGCTAIFLTGN